MRPLLGYLKGIVILSAIFAATADFGSDTSLPRRIHKSSGKFVNLVLALRGRGHVFAEQQDNYASNAQPVPGADAEGTLIGGTASYDEAGGANSRSFFGIDKGVAVASPVQDDPNSLLVTPFEQLLRGVQQ